MLEQVEEVNKAIKATQYPTIENIEKTTNNTIAYHIYAYHKLLTSKIFTDLT